MHNRQKKRDLKGKYLERRKKAVGKRTQERWWLDEDGEPHKDGRVDISSAPMFVWDMWDVVEWFESMDDSVDYVKLVSALVDRKMEGKDLRKQSEDFYSSVMFEEELDELQQYCKDMKACVENMTIMEENKELADQITTLERALDQWPDHAVNHKTQAIEHIQRLCVDMLPAMEAFEVENAKLLEQLVKIETVEKLERLLKDIQTNKEEEEEKKKGTARAK
ncbi:hypothetical protein RFI_11145 [Reticulomyxa filosa]|uniref:Uncharacterized protein n=1 Tax=Reticulomyxa filosa TaxID=46433 RepID=X6NJA3_RETFI|nr:hypothetical protein RFI_11145 [Reticulomyxa filosa]|eukprot:ETO25993.1 hypothetical protein RFI_11145 [Reticulomyxa filosa]